MRRGEKAGPVSAVGVGLGGIGAEDVVGLVPLLLDDSHAERFGRPYDIRHLPAERLVHRFPRALVAFEHTVPEGGSVDVESRDGDAGREPLELA